MITPIIAKMAPFPKHEKEKILLNQFPTPNSDPETEFGFTKTEDTFPSYSLIMGSSLKYSTDSQDL